MKKFIYPTLVLFISAISAFGQIENRDIIRGNDEYAQGNFEKAQLQYDQALKKNGNSSLGAFNRANAIYKQDSIEDALKEYESIANSGQSDDLRSKAFHNLGNSYLLSKKLEESINAYKKSLRINPKDDETRFNLAYAQKLLKEQEEQKKDDKDDKKDEEDKNDEKKKDEDKKDQKNEEKNDGEQNKDEEGKEDKKDPQEDENKGDKENEDPQDKQGNKPRPGQLTPEEAQRMLDAMQNEEEKVQEKLAKIKMKGQKINVEKDW